MNPNDQESRIGSSPYFLLIAKKDLSKIWIPNEIWTKFIQELTPQTLTMQEL